MSMTAGTPYKKRKTERTCEQHKWFHQHITGHFGDKSFQSIACTGTDNLTRTTKRQNTQITQM